MHESTNGSSKADPNLKSLLIPFNSFKIQFNLKILASMEVYHTIANYHLLKVLWTLGDSTEYVVFTYSPLK